MFAAILQRRISQTLDKHLQRTQFGFRKNRSTIDALQYVRRIAEMGFGNNTSINTHLLLLDWEKAFDKVSQKGLIKAMQRMGIDDHLIELVQALYQNPQFRTAVDGKHSNWHKQETGIRQGCPLSPYLFLIAMTAIFDDVKTEPRTHYSATQSRRNRL